jgi:hypothetical protein
MVINPDAPKRWTIHVRVTAAPSTLRSLGEHQWAIWCGKQSHMIKVMKATRACHFDQASKRWFFVRPAAEYGATLQKLLDIGFKIDLEDPRS